MSHRAASITALVGLAPALLASGCPRFDDGNYVFRDEFEGPLCDGAPCGWVRVAGAADSASWGESLPGEHGLHLRGSGVVVRIEPEDAMLELGTQDSLLVLDLIARCDVGSTLSVEVGALESFTGEIRSYEPTLSVGTNILTEWGQPRPNAVQLGSSGFVLDEIDSITIAKSGDGLCEIDSIGIFIQTFVR